MGKRHTILVVDDEPDVVQSVRDLLRLDYKVLTATKAEDGVRLMAEHAVDVVMTDQRMPEMTGVQFLDKIRGPHPEATRLLFTGYADIRAVIDAINQGNVYRYITKPWDPDELQTIIREACERHDLIVKKRELTDELQYANAELQAANARLQDADELKTAFIRVASHELRTPLTILNGYAQLAASAATTPPLEAWLARMKQAGGRLQGLIDQLLGMLAAGDFQTRARRQTFDVAGLLRDVGDEVETFIGLRHQTLVRDWPADLGELPADREKLCDGLHQLLLNAIKFTPDGGTITLAAHRQNDGVAFRVADTGCGMDEASLRQYGTAFFTQFDVARHSSGVHEHECRGLGLGASLVRKFAELHGGRMIATSEPGKGTTVTLYIPAAGEEAGGNGRDA